MAVLNKILKYELSDRTLELAVNSTTMEISRILTEELQHRGIADSVSQPTVARFLKDRRAERAHQTRTIVHTYINGTLPRDLESLDEALSFHLAIARGEEQSQAERSAAYLKAKSIIETKLRYSGVLESGESDDAPEAISRELEERLHAVGSC